MIKPGSTGHKLASLNLFFLICILGSTLTMGDYENFTFIHNPGTVVGRPSQLSLKRSPIKTMYECPAYYWNSQ